jgi:hypothetical protein
MAGRPGAGLLFMKNIRYVIPAIPPRSGRIKKSNDL